jgi:1-acyl-sn-glycerol-3-phosphate acyltransferase
MVYPFTRVTFFPLLRLFIRRIEGLESIPRTGPLIVACKHITALDGFFLASVLIPFLNQKVHFVANTRKWGMVWEKLVSQHWAGCIPFDKANRSHCLTTAQELLKKGKIVGIYPEGYLLEYGRNRYQARTGVARLALWERATIIPVGFRYNISLKNRLPVLYQYWKSIVNIFRHPRSLDIVFGHAFELKSYYNKPITRELLRQATNEVMSHIDSLCQIKNRNIDL